MSASQMFGSASCDPTSSSSSNPLQQVADQLSALDQNSRLRQHVDPAPANIFQTNVQSLMQHAREGDATSLAIGDAPIHTADSTSSKADLHSSQVAADWASQFAASSHVQHRLEQAWHPGHSQVHHGPSQGNINSRLEQAFTSAHHAMNPQSGEFMYSSTQHARIHAEVKGFIDACKQGQAREPHSLLSSLEGGDAVKARRRFFNLQSMMQAGSPSPASHQNSLPSSSAGAGIVPVSLHGAWAAQGMNVAWKETQDAAPGRSLNQSDQQSGEHEQLAPSSHEETRQAARNLQEVMSQDSQMIGSNFFKFLDDLQTGAIPIEVEDQEKQDDHANNHASALHGVEHGESSLKNEMLDRAWQEALNSQSGTYAFSSRNKNEYSNANDAFEQGVLLMRRGQVKQAIEALESAVAHDSSRSDAWLALGLAHAELDCDGPAIAAFKKAVEADPANMQAQLALGVSSANEEDDITAFTAISHWLSFHSSETTGLHLKDRPGLGSLLPSLLKALETRPNDADLHTVLGVVHHIVGDFDSAIEHFSQAANLNPADHSLLNKLGATLANSMRPAEAIDAYIKALEIRPNYVRALANLGISYSNQGLHMEASSCFLKALDINPEASHLWFSLRNSLAQSGKQELAEMTAGRSVEAFRPHFDF